MKTVIYRRNKIRWNIIYLVLLILKIVKNTFVIESIFFDKSIVTSTIKALFQSMPTIYFLNIVSKVHSLQMFIKVI
jgi:hypothetical protein